MSYKFPTKTDEELEEGDLLQEGIYDFLVAKSTRKESKAGNPMAMLQLTVWGTDGKPKTIFDFLIFSEVNMCIKKISNFCKATGLENEYKQGELREDLEGLAGKCRIFIQEPTPKTGGGMYPKKNAVDDYYVPTKKELEREAANAPFISDEIPF